MKSVTRNNRERKLSIREEKSFRLCEAFQYVDDIFLDIADVMRKMAAALKRNGIIYTSFKYGTFAGNRNGRFFTDMTEEKFAAFLGGVEGVELEVEEQWTTSDVRPGRGEEKWLNLILQKR